MFDPLRIASAIAAGAVVCAACGSIRIDPVAAMNPALMLAGTPTRVASTEVPTASFALDRITKRTARLTGTIKRNATGRGVTIYAFDGGIAEHSELAGRVRVGFDAFPSTPRVCNPHGLAVAAAAAGTTLGVAPRADVVDVKVIDCASGRGSVAAILAAARWTARDHLAHPDRPAVANWSFVVDTTRAVPGIDSAIAILHDAGLLVVASAGNFDIDACRVSPANSGGAIVVGAASLLAARNGDSLVLRDVRTSETAWGDCVDLYAPGDGVPLPSLERGQAVITSWTGTSMAAGYVSGAASLVLEQLPAARPDAVARILLTQATSAAVDERVDSTRAAPRTLKPLLYAGPE